MCRKCFGFYCDADDDRDVTLDGDLIQKMTKFLYLVDVLSSEGDVQEAVTARLRSGWKKFKGIASVL